MSIRFIVCWKDGNRKPQKMERIYKKKIVSIGRNIRNDFCIPDRFVSRYHVRIEFKDNAYLIYDLGSTHGTYLNGKKLEQNKHQTLNENDTIKIAETEIVFSSEKSSVKSATTATPPMRKASYESLSAILNRFLPDVSSFESEEDIRMFCDRLQGILEIFFVELSTNLESYSQLQYQFDAQTTQTATQKNNPLKTAKTGNEAAKYLLDWHNDDTLTTINFLKGACNDLAGSQIAVFKTLTSSLPALLEKISPESMQKKCQNNKQKQVYFDKLFMQTYKNLWNEYEKRHKELMENENRRSEIIKKEFQKNYSDIIAGDQ